MTSQTFTCPACGAPQDPPTQPGQASVECRYCGHTVIVPEELRIPLPVEPPETKSEIPAEVFLSVANAIPEAANSVSRTFRTVISCALVLIILFITLAVLIPLVILPATNSSSSESSVEEFVPLEIPTFMAPLTPTEVSFAMLDMAIGQEGIGPGQFTDLRHVAVDSQGRIYAGEYTGGRIQVFDQDGNFITQWLVDDEFPLVSMAANRAGTVYIVMGGEVYLHDGPSGDYQGAWDYDNQFDDVFSTIDGGLLAAHGGTDDNILRFDAGQNLELEIPSAISGQTGDSELKMTVAEDGVGIIYALGAFNDAVFIYDSQGKFLNRIGSSGDEPGQFQAVSDIVVDGQGRIYVSDFDGVKVFSPDGRFLGLIETENVAFGLAIDDQDNLYVAARTQLYRYSLP
jgi:hypothetical protein